MNRPKHLLNTFIKSQAVRMSIFCAALFLIYVSLSCRDWSIFFKSQEEFRISYFEDNINDKAERLKKHLVNIQGKWLATSYGLSLLPSSSGQLTLEFSKKPEQGVFVNLWFYKPRPVKNQVVFASQYKTARYNNIDLRGQAPFDISQLTHGEDKFKIILRCSVPPGFPTGSTLLDKISISFIDTYHANFPALSSFLACLFTGLFLIFILRNVFSDDLKVWGVSFAISLVLILLLSYKFIGFAPSMIFMSAVFVCYAILSYRKDKRLWQDKRIYLGLLFLLLVFGLEWRWTLLQKIWPVRLDPDAEGYLALARQLSWLYDTGMREPLFIWLIKIFCSFTAWSNLNLRFLTVALSIGVIVVTYWAGARLFNRVVGILAAGFVIFALPFIRMSVRGLRFEIFTMLFMVFVTRALSKNNKEQWAIASVFDGLIAGLVCLVRLNIIGIILLLWLYQGIRMKWNYKMPLIRIAVLLMLIAPHLYNNYKISQPPDPFFSVNIHTLYYCNQEFAGQPGFPSQEVIAKTAYVGEPISFFSYVFKLHSFGEVINRTSLGLVSIFLGFYTKTVLFSNNLVFYILFILGAVALLFSEKRILLLFLIVMQIPQAFILTYPLNWSVVLAQPGAIPWRLVLPIAPFLLMITFYAPFGWWEIFSQKVPAILSKFRAKQKNTRRRRHAK